jgi:hypothetical protein
MSAREQSLEGALLALIRELDASAGRMPWGPVEDARRTLLNVPQPRRSELECALYQRDLFAQPEASYGR